MVQSSSGRKLNNNLEELVSACRQAINLLSPPPSMGKSTNPKNRLLGLRRRAKSHLTNIDVFRLIEQVLYRPRYSFG